jgi:hypothetical protein
MRAYIDESVRVADPGLYVLASVVVPSEGAEDVRHALRDALRPRRRRFHWRDEEDGDRQAMAKLAAELQLASVVAVSTPMDRRRPERARRVCMTRLLWELGERGVHDMLFESRQHRDRDDRSHILSAQKAGHAHQALRYAFAGALEEPLLWLPDLVAGAVAYARADVDVQYLETLGAQVVVVEAGGAV